MVDLSKVKSDLLAQGFAHIPGFLSNSEELKSFKAQIKFHLDQFSRKKGFYEPGLNIDEQINKLLSVGLSPSAFLNDSLNISLSLDRLLSSQAIEDLIKRLFSWEQVLRNNGRFRVQIPGHDEISNLPWHQDSHYNTFCSSDQSIVVWLSISKINFSQGPVVFLPKSQLAGMVEKVEHVKSNNKTVYTVNDSEVKKYDEISLETDEGDLVLIDMNVIHRSGYNKSNKTKFSAQVRMHNLELML